MPLFEYKCRKCEAVTEFLESANIERRHVCEKCGSEDTTKLLSSFAALVKQRAAGGKCDSCPESKCPYSG